MLEKEKISKEEYQVLSRKYRELEDLVNDLKKGFKSLDRFQKFYELLLKKVDRIVEKRLEEENRKLVQEKKELRVRNEELRKENKIWRERAAKESKDCKELQEKYEELKKEKNVLGEKTLQEKKEFQRKNKELQIENEELRKENDLFKEMGEKYKVSLVEHFLSLQETLWKMDEKYKIYEEFFNDSVLPLQILIGLDKGMERQTEERIDYYIWDVIIEPLIGVVKKRKGEFYNGRLVLPEQGGLFEKERIAKKIEQESFDKVERYIKEDERRVELKGIVLQKKRMVEDLGRMLEEFKEIAKEHKIEKKEISRLAKEARFLFERNGIYPLFAEELKEYPDSEVKKRMIPVNSNSIRYPGLFIKQNGVLEVLGTNIGMDDC